jgi:hypothetical protein
VRIFSDKDWVLFVLGVLIIGFTLSKMFKTRGGKEPLSDGKKEL